MPELEPLITLSDNPSFNWFWIYTLVVVALELIMFPIWRYALWDRGVKYWGSLKHGLTSILVLPITALLVGAPGHPYVFGLIIMVTAMELVTIIRGIRRLVPRVA